MPSKSAKQARLMRAVAHGWKPDRFKGPPVSVAKDFVAADKRAKKGFAAGGALDLMRQPIMRSQRGALSTVGLQGRQARQRTPRGALSRFRMV